MTRELVIMIISAALSGLAAMSSGMVFFIVNDMKDRLSRLESFRMEEGYSTEVRHPHRRKGD